MQIAVRADELQKKAWLEKGFEGMIVIEWIGAHESLKNIQADAYFDLLFEEDAPDLNEYPADKILFINSISITAAALQRTNIIRLNAWDVFLNNDIIEVAAANEEDKLKAEAVLKTLGWKYIWAPDEPGMIAARVISMIINEAYYGLQDKISTKEDIDIAMKLGTNYPYGPFEWAQKIGLKNIYRLLKKLSKTSERYTVAALLEEEVRNMSYEI